MTYSWSAVSRLLHYVARGQTSIHCVVCRFAVFSRHLGTYILPSVLFSIFLHAIASDCKLAVEPD